MKTVFTCLLGMCLSSFGNELPAKLQEGMTFHLTFTETIQAQTASGSTDPKKTGSEPEFTEGISGKGIVIGGTSPKRLQYEREGNIDVSQGTLSFWVKPVNWNEKAIDIVPLFQLGVAHEGYLGLQVVGSSEKGRRLMFFSLNFEPQGREKAIIRGDSEWTDGVWRQVVLVWNGDEVKLYTDRGIAGEAKLTKAFQHGDIASPSFYLGGNENATMVMDEVRIWNRAFSEEEVGQLQNSEAPE